MKYEVIKGKDDVYVLVINNVIVLISHDISAITKEIEDDAKNRLINPRRTYEDVVIDLKESVKKYKYVDDRPLPQLWGGETAKKPDDGSLGKLFSL